MGYLSEISTQPGVPGSPGSQPAALGLKGSDAMTLISTRSHLGHSNNRCSKPIGPGKMRSSIILVWQCEQLRRSVAVKDCVDEGTMLPRYLGGRADLPVADNCLFERRWSQSCPTHQREAGQYRSLLKISFGTNGPLRIHAGPLGQEGDMPQRSLSNICSASGAASGHLRPNSPPTTPPISPPGPLLLR
jgi:hypothetical protein